MSRQLYPVSISTSKKDICVCLYGWRIPFFEEHRFHRARAVTRFPTRHNINNNKTEEPDERVHVYTEMRVASHTCVEITLSMNANETASHHCFVSFLLFMSTYTKCLLTLSSIWICVGFSYHNGTYIGTHTPTVVIRNEIKQKSYKTDVYNIKNGSNTQNFGIIKGLPQILPLFYFPFFSEFILLYVRLRYL